MKNASVTWEMPIFSQLNGNEKYVAEIVHTFRQQFTTQLPATLWHYATFDNIKNIIRSQELWFSHVSLLQDQTEIIRIAKITSTIITHAIDTYALSQRTVVMLNELKAGLLNDRSQSPWYTCSFTELTDSSQHWKDYGNGGTGVSVGFCASELIKFFSTSVNDRPMIGGMIYDTSQSATFIAKLIQFAIRNFESDYSNISDQRIAARNFVSQWGQHAEPFSIFPKIETLSWEAEWRLGKSWYRSEDPPNTITKGQKKFWPQKRGINSDSKLMLLPINKIIVGIAAPVAAEEELRKILSYSGYAKIDIRRSDKFTTQSEAIQIDSNKN